MDFFSEFMSIKDEEYLSGVYYKSYPNTTNDYGEEFTYTIVNPKSREYRSLITNLQGDGATLTIKTRKDSAFSVNSLVRTQDGLLWQISSVNINPQTEEGKETLRLFKTTSQTERIIRLIEIENPMNI
jgi:hypothetical protein